MAGSIAAPERERLNRTYHDAVGQRLLPAVRALHDFLAKDYLPKARTSLSITDLPLGAAWYAYRLRRATGGPQGAADLHRQGLAEVERLKARGLPADVPPRTRRGPAERLPAAWRGRDAEARRPVRAGGTAARAAGRGARLPA